MKRLVLLTAAASLGIGTLAAVPAAAAAPVPALKWSKCSTDPNDPMSKAECAMLKVPLDYRHPRGRKIEMAVSRVRATDRRHYKGVLLGNPGGPGASGLRYSAGLGRWLAGVGHPEVAASYDIIGFAPRGVGESKPAVVCDPHYNDGVRPDYVPAGPVQERRWISKSREYAKDCARKWGWLLPHVRTANVARDMDLLRAALGQRKINYYGFSYGTYLGATYGTLFPNRVGRFVLDGNVDTREVWYEAQLSQDRAFERNIKFWFGWMAKWDGVFHLGKTQAQVERTYYRTRAQAKRHPIGGKIGPSELDDSVLNAAYYTSTYVDIAKAFSAWAVKRDPKPLLEMRGEYDDNGFAMYLAVQGADARWPRNWSKWHRDAAKLYRQGYRFNTWSNVWFNAPVAFWPFQGGPAPRINGRGMNQALLIQGEYDAATPYPGGPQMHKVLPSRLIKEIGGKTHANTLNGNKCLDDKVAAYLNTGWLPASRPGPDAFCKAVPALNDPNPNAVRSAGTYDGKDLPVGFR